MLSGLRWVETTCQSLRDSAPRATLLGSDFSHFLMVTFGTFPDSMRRYSSQAFFARLLSITSPARPDFYLAANLRWCGVVSDFLLTRPRMRSDSRRQRQQFVIRRFTRCSTMRETWHRLVLLSFLTADSEMNRHDSPVLNTAVGRGLY
jgi:hypothetical protein